MIALAVKNLLRLLKSVSWEDALAKYIYTVRGTSRDIAIKERKIINIEIKVIPFIIYFRRNCIIMNR